LHDFVDQLFLTLINGGIILGIFVILLINNKSVRKSRANIFLSILLGAFTFSIFHVRYAGNVMNHFSVKAYNMGDPTFLLIAPLLWFYIIEITGSRVKFTHAFYLHFIPFFIIVFCSLSFKSLPHDNPLITFLTMHPRLPIIIFWLMVVAQFLGYQLVIHRKWMAFQQFIKQEVSNTEDVNISWVRFFMRVFLVINLFFLVSLFAVVHLNYMAWLWKIVGVIFSLSVFALGYKGILQREIFDAAPQSPLPGVESSVSKINKADPQLVDKLLSFMKDKKPYLDSELSLSKLAQAVGMNRSQLSQLINDGVGENFYDFVNHYRIEEVKRLMVDPQMNNFNLLGIALEAGFKSKSTFNLIFKRFTGLTPTEYKKNITE
jgi:AraC-like DNA-binding protein